MTLKALINKSVYGTNGYISSLENFNKIEQYIIYNLPVLKEFKQIIISTNYGNDNTLLLMEYNFKLWKKYFPDCIIIDSGVNRGPAFGTADLDNIIFDYCKTNNIEWLCKSDNDIILQEKILNKEINEADFYYLNGIGYGGMEQYNFNFDKIIEHDFYPQTWFYFLDVSKCDYLNNKEYIDETYNHIQTISQYSGKPWEYIKEWSCEFFLKQCIERNNLTKYHLLNKQTYNKLCNIINMYKIYDSSYKNIMVDGICHLQYFDQNIIEL